MAKRGLERQPRCRERGPDRRERKPRGPDRKPKVRRAPGASGVGRRNAATAGFIRELVPFYGNDPTDWPTVAEVYTQYHRQTRPITAQRRTLVRDLQAWGFRIVEGEDGLRHVNCQLPTQVLG